MTMGLKTDGTLWGWGQNDQFEMGNGTCCANQLTPIQVGSATNWESVVSGGTSFENYTIATQSDGTVWVWGDNQEVNMVMVLLEILYMFLLKCLAFVLYFRVTLLL